MPRRSKTNFLDSLFGGFAQGLQLSQQLKDQQKQRELQERGFGLQERGLDIREQQLTLDEQKALAAQKFREQFQQLFPGLKSSELPGLDIAPAPTQQQQPQVFEPLGPVQPATLGGVTTPQIQPRTPSTVTPRPSIPAFQGGITEEALEVPSTDRQFTTIPGGGPIIQPSPDQLEPVDFLPAPPFEKPVQPTTEITPTVIPSRVTKPIKPQLIGDEVKQQQLDSIRDFVAQLDAVKIDEPTTVTLSIPGAGSISKTVGKNLTMDQRFRRFNNEISKAFPSITPSEKAQILANSPMRDSKAAKEFFDRSFNSAVNRSFLLKKESARLDKGRPLTTVEKNGLLGNAVEETVEQFGGHVSKRHEKLFDQQKVERFNIPEKMQAILATEFADFEELDQMFANDREGAEAKLESALKQANIPDAKVNLKKRADGKIEAIIETRDAEGNISFDTKVASDSDFRVPTTIRQSPQQLAAVQVVKDAGNLIVNSEDIQRSVNKIVRTFKSVPPEEINTILGAAGGFNRFTNNLIEQLKGFAGSSLIPGAKGAKNVLDAFQKSDQFQQLIGGKGAAAQRLFTEYGFLILKTAGLIGLGQGRALSDKDLVFVQNLLSQKGATSFEAAITALNDEANSIRAFNVDVVKRAESGKLFEAKPPNPNPFTGEVVQPGQPLVTPQIFRPDQGTQAPSPQQPGSLGELDSLLKNEGF